MPKKTLLIIFTYKYPFEPPTEQFLDDELPYLLKEDIDVLFVPTSRSKSDVQYPIVNGNKALSIHEIKRASILKELFIGIVFTLGSLKYLFSDLFRLGHHVKPGYWLYAFKTTLLQYIHGNALFYEFKKQIPKSIFQDRSDVILYSYWLNATAYAEALYKKHLRSKLGIRAKAFARAHGDGDIYFNVALKNYRPFVSYLNREIDAFFPISDGGENKLKKQGFRNTEIYRLGVVRRSDFIPAQTGTPLIVSCSVINDNKRVEKIAEILSAFSEKVRWVHFGGGPNEQKVFAFCKKILPANVEFELRGWTDHNAVMSFYGKERPDLFINASKVEGIPVSVMEAMSFSIPCVATDVGASREIVKDNSNGFLLKPDFDPKETAQKIIQYLYRDSHMHNQIRRNAYDTFLKGYESDNNYTVFAKRIISDKRN